MPKKRTYNFKQLQGKSSSSQSNGAQRTIDGNAPSVNERLSELRKLEARDAAARKRELAESSNQRSVPPQVQGILGVPESAPPKSKAGVRTRERLRTPGPAPPRSWTTVASASAAGWSPALAVALRGARRGLKKSANKLERRRPKELLRFARLSGLERGEGLVGVRKLTHYALKAIAESWDLFDEDEYPVLADIPLRLRLRLISYLGFYGPIANAAGIDALLQGSELLDHLDLASLVGHGNLTIKKLGRILVREDRPHSGEVAETVAESWDAEEIADLSLNPSPRLNRAAHLTHLSLSHPGPGASWRDLLAFSKHIPQVTHLSLAYWPWPTLTPNLSTATVAGQHGQSFNAGGSDYYSSMDQSLEEPALLLRQLSSHLLCLQWLDVEGCHQWSAALAELAQSQQLSAQPFLPVRQNAWPTTQGEPPILTTNWKNLTHIRWAQGWLPDYHGVRALQTSSALLPAMEILVGRRVEQYLETRPKRDDIPSENMNDYLHMENARAKMWMQNEAMLSHAALKISLARREFGCRPIVMDYGWETRETALFDPSRLGPRT